MAFRLVALVEGRPLRIPLHEGEHELGSSPSADVRIDQATVSRRHALLVVDADSVTIRDLGSRNGVRVGSRKVKSARLEAGARLMIGSVAARLEEIPDHDLEAAMVLGDPMIEREPGVELAASGGTTSSTGPLEVFAAERLPDLLRRLRLGVDRTVMAQLVGETLHSILPCLAVHIGPVHDRDAVLFEASRAGSGRDRPETVEHEAAGLAIAVEMPSPRSAAVCAPLLVAAGEILALAAERDGPAEPEQQPGLPPQLPDPPTVVPRVRQIYGDAARVARGDVSVLILGESGTGKELLAGYVHAASRRSDGPLLGLNCASLPQDLLESELFGIERGVATGVDERPGKFEQASGGSLFLDEVGDMALETQAKILRVLQSGESYRLGAREPRRVDVRVVAATNRDIKEMLADGSFRTDLYHRIATWVVELPPLRHRRADIANLAAYFLAREAARQGLEVAGISRAALEALVAFHWPGNVRQLENEMARAVLFLEPGELLDTSRLSEEVRAAQGGSGASTLAEVLERVERDEILQALGTAGGVVEAAAERLGISRATLYRRMKALEIEPPK
jgi:DNA-binding NtrC family response regulator